MLNPPENLTLVAFKSSEGIWTAYALNPPGPSPIKCDPEWEWCAIQNGQLYEKPEGKRQFKIARPLS